MTGAAGVAVAAPAPLRLPPVPRRVSGPARHPRATPAAPVTPPSLLLRLIDHPWLERIVRGRAWIAIVASVLLAIVAMQVVLLRLGAQIGRDTSTVNALIAQNESTAAAIGALEASRRVTAEARALQMVYPQPSAVTYLAVNPGDASRAVRMMTAPSSVALAYVATSHVAASAPATKRSGATGATATLAGGATQPASGATGAHVSPATATANTSSGAPGGAASSGALSTASSGTSASSPPATRLAPTTPLGH